MADFAVNSTIISYQRSFNSFSSCDGVLNMDQPLVFPGRSVRKVRLLRASISSSIANIWSGTAPDGSAFNNALIRLTRDGGVTWLSLTLPNGVYTPRLIQLAINHTLGDAGWYLDELDPGVLVEYNNATSLIYVELISTKLAPGGVQLGIDFSQSRISEVLGFITTKTFIVDGLYGGSHIPQMDWVGNNVSVQISGIGGLSYLNGSVSEEICQIPLATAVVSNEYWFPREGMISPILNATVPDRLSQMKFSFVGTRTDSNRGRPVMIIDGQVSVCVQFLWS